MSLILILSQGQEYIKQSTVPMVAMNHNAEPANNYCKLMEPCYHCTLNGCDLIDKLNCPQRVFIERVQYVV